MPEELVAEALRYLVDTPIRGGHTLDFPNSLESSLCVWEQSLDCDSVNVLVTQLSEWAGRSTAMPLVVDHIDDGVQSSRPRVDRAMHWIKYHRLLAPIIIIGIILITIVAFLGSVLNLADLVTRWWE